MKTTSKIRNYTFYALLIAFLIVSIISTLYGGRYSSISASGSSSATKLEMLIHLVGYILNWFGWLGMLISAYVWKKMYENPEL
jgi:ABC-type transport system involved in multi-copper enzyme maturation permease subunit